MKLYECPTHNQEFETGSKHGCEHCYRISKILRAPKKYPGKELKHTRMSVYWGRNADALSEGRTIENLGHRPVHFRNKDQFRDFLKHNGVGEAR